MIHTEQHGQKPSTATAIFATLHAFLHAPGSGASSITLPRLHGRLTLAVLAATLTLASSPASAAQSHGFIGSFGSSGTAAGQFDFTSESGLAVDQSSGDVYVADTGNHRIEKFAPDGTFIAAWGWGVANGASEFQVCASSCRAGLPGHSPGQFEEPSQFEEPTFIAVDNTPGGAGDVYVPNQGAVANERQTVTVSATAGTYTLSFTTTQRGTTTSGSNLVTAIPTTVYKGYNVGDAISGPGIPAGTTITEIDYELHTLTLSANATASATAVLTITETTAAINYSASASATELQAALEGLGVLEEGGVSVSGAAGGPYTVEFTRTGIDLPQMTADSSGLSGVAATATVATALDGFNANHVQKFDPSGSLIAAWGSGGQLNLGTTGPEVVDCSPGCAGPLDGIVVKPEGNLMALNDGLRYTEWSQSSGGFVGWHNFYEGGFPVPIGIAIDSAGNVYQGVFGGPPHGSVHQLPQNFTVDPGPATGVAVDPSNDAVYIAHHSDVASYNSQGNSLESSIGGNGEITAAAGIAVNGSDSDVYVADQGANRIEIFAPGGPRDVLTVTRSGSGLGSVSSEPAGIACPPSCTGHFPAGEALTLTATAPAHSTFLGFSGGGCSGTAPCQITLIADTSLIATFAHDRPALTTAAASDIARHTATLTGTVNPEGDASSCAFQYGPTAAYGFEAPCSTHPGSGAAPLPVGAQLWDLAASTTYHYRLLSANSGGTAASADQTFTTLPDSCATNAALCTPPPTCATEPSLCLRPRPQPLTCRKGFVKRHGKCVKRKSHHRKPRRHKRAHHRANANHGGVR